MRTSVSACATKQLASYTLFNGAPASGEASAGVSPPVTPCQLGIRRYRGLMLSHSPGRLPHFNSTDQYAFSKNVFQDWYFRCVSLRFNRGLRFGFSGLRMRVK